MLFLNHTNRPPGEGADPKIPQRVLCETRQETSSCFLSHGSFVLRFIRMQLCNIIQSMSEADLYNFLKQCKLGVLATLGETNVPQSALVGIAVTKDLDIVFDTVKTSRKYPNLIARPACSFVIGWTGEETVQFEGIADELAGGELQRYQHTYFNVWPECRGHMSWPGITYFVVRPRWIRYSNFDHNPPLIQEFTR